MLKRRIVIVLVALAVVLSSCKSDMQPYKKHLKVKVTDYQLDILRYDKEFFSADTNDFAVSIACLGEKYRLFLDGDLTDPDVLKYLRDFATDPFAQMLSQKTEQAYPDDAIIKSHIANVVSHISYYYPEKRLSGKVYTFVSGLDHMTPSVFFDNKNDVVVALDYYLSDNDVYSSIGMPKYRSIRTYPDFISRDVAMSFYDSYLCSATSQGSLLDEMVKAGKALFFVEAMNPNMPDTILLGYTTSQIEWLKAAEPDIWKDVVGNSLLYSSQREVFMSMLNDGPFTQRYSYDAPSRIGEYIGLQIIRSYMNTHDDSLQELMANNDLQGIFNESGYRPK